MDDENKNSKTAGYLEKRGKLKVVSQWKKYWFVLEGRLLLYYRSKDEYEAISPCKGTINLGPPCTVKPCSSLNCAFQIETRANTVTLRAENKADQARWMQAIMFELKQNIHKVASQKLNHFRYSRDNLILDGENGNQPECNQDIAQTASKRNSMLRERKGSKDMIERLRKIGAQTYGGSVGTISKLASNIHHYSNNDSIADVTNHHRSSLHEKDVSEKSSRSSRTSSYLFKSDSNLHRNSNRLVETKKQKPTALQRQSKFDAGDSPPTGRTKTTSKFSLKSVEIDYDRKQKPRSNSLVIDNEQYISIACDLKLTSEKNLSLKDLKVTSAENLSLRDLKLTTVEDASHKRHSFLYPIKKSSSSSIKSSSEMLHGKNSLVVENDQYMSVSQDKKVALAKPENLYSRISGESNSSREKSNDFLTNLVKENSEYVAFDDNTHYTALDDNTHHNTDSNGCTHPNELEDPVCSDHNKNNVLFNNSLYLSAQEYEIYSEDNDNAESLLRAKEIENVYEDPDVILKDRHSSKSSVNSDKSKKSKGRLKSLTEKFSRSKSHTKEKPPKLKKSSSFIQRVLRKDSKVEKARAVTSVTVGDDPVVLLTELQDILEKKKSLLKEKTIAKEEEPEYDISTQHCCEKDDQSTPASSVEETITERRNDEEDLNVSTMEKIIRTRKNSASASDQSDHEEKEICPALPVKNRNRIRPPTSINETATGANELSVKPNNKNIYEILEDLSNEEDSNKPAVSVKDLIKTFDPGVTLRQNSGESSYELTRDPDELNKLLEQLAQVTSAPIMTPGVTTSLLDPNTVDEELMKMIPARRRRKSDPDYDIPRPHKFLQIIPSSEFEDVKNVSSLAAPVTPTFRTREYEQKPKDMSLWSTMSPDSLELEKSLQKLDHSPTEENMTSYVSHRCYFEKSQKKQNSRSEFSSHKYTLSCDSHDEAYALPKPLFAPKLIRDCKNVCHTSRCNHGVAIVKYSLGDNLISSDMDNADDLSVDVFTDSLECCTEMSTAL